MYKYCGSHQAAGAEEESQIIRETSCTYSADSSCKNLALIISDLNHYESHQYMVILYQTVVGTKL